MENTAASGGTFLPEQHRRLQAHEGQEVFEATPVMLVRSRLRLDEKLW